MSHEQCTEIIEYKKFTEIVDDAGTLGAKTVCLSGGEPFLHPYIVEMIAYVSGRGMACYVYTSGIIFDSHRNRVPLTESLIRPIVGVVNKLIFNIEASTKETYNEIMGTRDCFTLLWQSVSLANSFSIVTEAHFVPMKLNANEVESIIDLCKNLGVSRLSFLRLVLHGRALDNKEKITLNDMEFSKLKERLERLKTQFRIDIRIGIPLSSNDGCHTCEAAEGKLNIKYDGHVFPCEVFKNDQVKMGLNGYYPENIYVKDLITIYKNSEYLRYVRDCVKKYDCKENCETCVGQYLINRNIKEE
jgi:MoaA/NifB/PqqE/SkfB family radical SAM enzyme